MESDSQLHKQVRAWATGIESELTFWDTWLRTRGMEWPDDFGRRLDPSAPLASEIVQLLGSRPQAALIIDVGAGPLSRIGQMVNGSRPRIVACDPLMRDYLALLQKHGLSPLTECVQAPAEDLSACFEPSSADVVHCSNALDHSFDPMRGIEEMLYVVKPEGAVILLHATNEAENEQYSGFHQWNFDEHEGCFLIWNRNERINVNEALAGIATVQCTRTQDGSGNVVVLKKDGNAFELANRCETRRRARILELHSALVHVWPKQQTIPRVSPAGRVLRGIARILR